MNNFTEKLKIVKKKFGSADVDTKKQIRDWGDRMARLQIQKGWLMHPNTEELVTLAREQIEFINNELSTNKRLDTEERLALFAAKDVHAMYLALGMANPDSEIESIERQLDENITP